MNTTTLVTILAYSVAFGITFVHISGIPNFIKTQLVKRGKWIERVPLTTYDPTGKGYAEHPKRLKPLDCEICMAFWSCVILATFPTLLTYTIINALFIGCIVACLTVLAYRFLKP